MSEPVWMKYKNRSIERNNGGRGGGRGGGRDGGRGGGHGRGRGGGHNNNNNSNKKFRENGNTQQKGFSQLSKMLIGMDRANYPAYKDLYQQEYRFEDDKLSYVMGVAYVQGAYIHTYIYTYMHAYIYTFIHTRERAYNSY